MAEKLTFDKIPSAIEAMMNKLEKLEGLLMERTDVKIDAMLSVDEACKLLRITKKTLYSKVNKKEVPFYKNGNRLFFSKTELEENIRLTKRISV